MRCTDLVIDKELVEEVEKLFYHAKLAALLQRRSGFLRLGNHLPSLTTSGYFHSSHVSGKCVLKNKKLSVSVVARMRNADDKAIQCKQPTNLRQLLVTHLTHSLARDNKKDLGLDILFRKATTSI